VSPVDLFSPKKREDFEAYEEQSLAPCALLASQSRGRAHPEPEHPFRTAFQRDRDRIIHSSAFRRLEYKTQVFVYHEGDYYRTRLTHSLETAQIARTIARILRLNEDVCETLALAHDLGHPPFGHAGETAMNELMKAHGGFNHNLHCLRIVEILEDRYPDFPGLNLTWEVREGIVKHTPDPTHLASKPYEPESSPTLETLAVDLSDEIAYNNHDLDDGLTSHMFSPEDLTSVLLWQETWQTVSSHYGKHDAASHFRSLMHETIKTIINRQVTDLIQTTLNNLSSMNIKTLADVRKAKVHPIAFSKPMQEKHQQLKAFLSEHMYRNHKVVAMTEKGKRILRDLFQTFRDIPAQLPPHISKKIGEMPVDRVVCDYIVGMTDKFALDEHRRLFDPHARFLHY